MELSATHKLIESFTVDDISRVIEMAWEDRTPFEAIEIQFGLDEQATIALMRSNMKASSFRMWRKRMSGRTTKHKVIIARHLAANHDDTHDNNDRA